MSAGSKHTKTMFLFRTILGPSRSERLLEVNNIPPGFASDRHSVFDTTQSTGGSPVHQLSMSKVTDNPQRKSSASSSVNENVMCSFAKRGKARGQLCRPGGVTVTINGDIVVVDTENCRIQVFSSAGHLRTVISEKGSSRQHVNQPMDVCMFMKDDKECICVSDSVNSCLKLFNLDGYCLDVFRSTTGDLEYPYGVCSSLDDRIVATDLLHHSVIVFDCDGNQVSKFGKFGDGSNELDHPYYVTVNRDNHIVVSNYGNMTIKIVTFGGDFLCQFSMKDFHIYQEDYVQLQGLTTDADGNVLVIGNSTVYVVANNGRFWEAILPCDTLDNPRGLSYSPLGYLVVTQEAKHQEEQVFVVRYPMENFKSLRAVTKPYVVKRRKSMIKKQIKRPQVTDQIQIKPTICHDVKQTLNVTPETQATRKVGDIPAKESKSVKFSEKVDKYEPVVKEEPKKPSKREKREKINPFEKKERQDIHTKYRKKNIYSDIGDDFILGPQPSPLDYELIERKRRLKAKSEDRSRVSPAHIFNFS